MKHQTINHQPLFLAQLAVGNVVNTAEVDEAAAEAECSACGGEWLEAGDASRKWEDFCWLMVGTMVGLYWLARDIPCHPLNRQPIRSLSGLRAYGNAATWSSHAGDGAWAEHCFAKELVTLW